jgi:hypothetical protein
MVLYIISYIYILLVLKETDRRIPTPDGSLISSYEDDTSSSVLNRGPPGGGTDEDAAEGW